jgi:hypothetical protein
MAIHVEKTVLTLALQVSGLVLKTAGDAEQDQEQNLVQPHEQGAPRDILGLWTFL